MCSRKSLVSLVLIAAFIGIVAGEGVPSCLDDDGKPVDWYIVYKMPLLSNDGAPFDTGYSYAYITSDDVKKIDPTSWTPPVEADEGSIVFLNRFRALLLKYLRPGKKARISKTIASPPKGDNLQWTVSSKLITDPSSMVLRTLRVAYKKEHSDLNTIFYNDNPGDHSKEGSKKNSAKAHAKGAIVMNEKTGDSIWLTHSAPQFPPPRHSELEFSPNLRTKAQTFMCINFDLERTGKKIVNHLVNFRPLVYDIYVSERLYSMIPEVRDLKKPRRKRKRDATTKLAQVITTKGGQDLTIYSKSAHFGEDMYAKWINHELNTPLLVETWRNGNGGALNSSCPRDDFHVNNVQDLKILSREGSSWSWSAVVDHSKWAISESQDSGVVCIADVNRMESQFKRGGGAVCFRCSSCWSAFSRSIVDVEPCPVGLSKKIAGSPRVNLATENLVKNLRAVYMN